MARNVCIYLTLLVLVAAVSVSGTRLPDECSLVCDVDAAFLPETVSMVKDSDDTILINTNITGSDALNFSVSVDSEDSDLAKAIEEPEVTVDPVTGFLVVRLTIFSGKQYGITTLKMTMKWWSNGEQVVVAYNYQAAVIRPVSYTSIQQILEYIVMGIALAVCFLAGCETTFSDVKKWSAWIVCTLLLQVVLVPICCLALVDLFTLRLVPKMGVMTVMYSPAALVSVCFAAVIEAEVGLSAILVISHLLLANLSISIWVLQFRRLDEQFAITTSDLPYDVMVILLAVAIPLFLGGMLVRRYQKQFADVMAKITVPVSLATILLTLVGSICSGLDLISSLEWRSGLCAVVVPLVLAIIVIVIILGSSNASPRMRAASMFLLVKALYIPSVILDNAFHQPQLEAALVPAYVLSVTTILGASLVAFTYVFYTCLLKKAAEGDDKAKLVLQIDPEDEILAAEEDSKYRIEYERKTTKTLQDEDLAGALMNAGSFGVPSVVWF